MAEIIEQAKEISRQGLDRSVKPPYEQTSPMPGGGIGPEALIWMVALHADEFEPWGTARFKTRDVQLRNFITKENQFASGLGVVCARNAGFDWMISGSPRTAARAQQVLEDSDQGAGWPALATKLTIDLSTQDSGAFMEIVRESDRPEGALLALNHLDASRCWATGDPLKPVIYLDRLSQYHLLNWWQVVHFLEMPAPVERIPGLQICAESRLLLAAQIIRNISIYKAEKTGGRHNRAIHLVQGITTQAINDALADMRVKADDQGLLRYINPLIVGSHDPKATIDVKTLEIAALPDGFNEEVAFKHYVAQIAMAFGSDYQEFAPLPGGGLGTSTQSEVLHAKARGKGPGLWRKIIKRAMNQRVLPKNVEFDWDEQDLEAEKAAADIELIRATSRQIRIQSEEITQAEGRQLALDAGDLPQEMFEAAGGLDYTPRPVREGEQPSAPGSEEQGPVREGERSHRRGECMATGCSTPPTMEVIWAEGKSHSWFCDPHLREWETANPYEINARWPVRDGRASRGSPRRKELGAHWLGQGRWYE